MPYITIKYTTEVACVWSKRGLSSSVIPTDKEYWVYIYMG